MNSEHYHGTEDKLAVAGEAGPQNDLVSAFLREGGQGAHDQNHLVSITVNNKAVEVMGPHTTGFEIKECAIAQHVSIEADFVLSEELAGGKARIVRDDETVTVHPHSKFLAVAPDDNS